ncbi:MAG: hypothetical protein O3A25_14265 [Acidobacteria bacterium]|nr:hypothetical protein [Acidobacteriota bacterium]
MTTRSLVLLGSLTALACTPPVAVVAQTTQTDGWTMPRRADGRPDISGVWANNTAIPFERPEAWTEKDQLTAEELAELKVAASKATNAGEDALFGDQLVLAAIKQTEATSYDPTTGNYNGFWIAERTFSERTSLVVDPPEGRLPPMTPAAEALAAARAAQTSAHPADTYSDRPLPERCISYGSPNLQAAYNSYSHIVQGTDHVVIVQEMIHDARVIPIDGPARPPTSVGQLHGVSRGHWDGDTLVVETTHYQGTSGYRQTSAALTVTERFTRVGPETLHHEITFEDKDTWTAPWTVILPLEFSPDPIFEYACHEGNIGMEGILAGHRAEEREAGEQ